MNLESAIEAEQSSTETTETTTTEEETEIPFEPNESTEGYALFADSTSLVEGISTEVFDNDPVYSLLEWGMTLEDYPDIDTDDLSGQQKLDLLHKLAKGTFGNRQSELNEGYGMGWNTNGEGPPTVYDNDKVDHVPYLDVYSDLPAFAHETLDAGEIEQLESEGLDMDDFGFDDSIEGPQLPVIDGERVPILYENGDEVVRFLEMMNSIDLEEVTYCPENGELQGTPTLGGDSEVSSEVSTDGGSREGGETDLNLAANPEAIGEFSVNDAKKAVTDISRRRTLQKMLEVEKNGKDRSITDRIEQRIRAVTDEASDEEVSEAVEDDSDDDLSFEEVVKMFDLSDLEQDAVQHRVEAGKADSYREAGKAVAEV